MSFAGVENAHMTGKGKDRLTEVLQVINELAQKAAGGDYLYRGEPKCFELVSSSLYRKHAEIEAEEFEIEVVQSEVLQEVKRFIRETNEDSILEQLQHFSYPTNQIDFTTDYNVALFFASYSEFEKDGRVILLDKSGRSDLKEPKAPENRIIAQKSVFVRPSMGFVEPSDAVIIVKDLKRQILDYLDKSHGINAATLFNDIHGFIRYHNAHRSAYSEFYTGLTHGRRGEYSEAIIHFTNSIAFNPQSPDAHYNRGVTHGSMNNYDLAIEDYNRAIELDPEYAAAHNNRGNASAEKGEYDKAIQDFKRAIEFDPYYPLAYYNLGVTFLCREEWANAESYLYDALALGLDFVYGFREDFGSVEAFEQNHYVQLPDHIKEMLTPKQ